MSLRHFKSKDFMCRWFDYDASSEVNLSINRSETRTLASEACVNSSDIKLMRAEQPLGQIGIALSFYY